MHFIKNLSKLVNFCAAILILKIEGDMEHFWCIMLYNFKKGKNNWNAKKDLCSVWRRCCNWLNMSKVVSEVSWYYWHFGQIILSCGAVLMLWKMFSSTPGLHLLQANSRRYPTYSKYPNQSSYWWKWKVCLLWKKCNGLGLILSGVL